MNAYQYFRRSFAFGPERTFLEWDGGSRFTYADLERETARFATLLTGLGLVPGDRVAAQVDKSPQGLFLYLGCLRAGLAFLPLNTAYQRDELDYFLRDAEPRAVVCRPALRASSRNWPRRRRPGIRRTSSRSTLTERARWRTRPARRRRASTTPRPATATWP